MDSTVRYLISTLTKKGYNLFMDNFYISVRLAHELTGDEWLTNVCGTMRKHRGEPDEIKKVTLKSMALGERVVCHNGTVMVVAWKAKPKKIMKLLTTHHPDRMVSCTQRKAGHREPLRQGCQTQIHSGPKCKEWYKLRAGRTGSM